jgi:hypothetical protein
MNTSVGSEVSTSTHAECSGDVWTADEGTVRQDAVKVVKRFNASLTRARVKS